MNPITMPIEAIKLMFLSKGTIIPGHLALSVGAMILLLISGVLAFNKFAKTVIDTV